MVDGINALGASSIAQPTKNDDSQRLLPRDLRTEKRTGDILQLGSGEKPNAQKAQGIVLERAYERLRQVVGEARTDLGIAEGAEIDTSPDATANRIADFALGFFSKYAENNGLANDEAGRKQYVDFIGKAVAQGIDEARGILGALNALSGDVSTNIDKTSEVINQRFQNFIANGQ
jgi:hypothetical protein